ncbi:MAG TPA: hypothetical protein VGB98_08565 [Pyrinomonadaceae bacterium]|jgi:hypothetical protein
MLCPFCLTELQPRASQCGPCSRHLPSDYVKAHGNWWRKKPAIVSVIGFSGHGKTVYLASLFYALQKLAPNAWAGFYRQGLTLKTLEMLYRNLDLLMEGRLPDSTQPGFPEPNIDRLHKIPQFGDRTLLIYDPPGEAFELLGEEGEYIQKHAGFVRHSRCALFLVSLKDMMTRFETTDAVANEMHRLLETYNVGMTNMGAPRRSQHLIVVYTKGDLLPGNFEGLPEEVADYLERDGVTSLRELGSYMEGMRRNSRLLREFSRGVLNAENFLGNADDHFKTVEFCAVSALGAQPVGDRLSERITPRRVLDPLLWVLEKSFRLDERLLMKLRKGVVN